MRIFKFSLTALLFLGAMWTFSLGGALGRTTDGLSASRVVVNDGGSTFVTNVEFPSPKEYQFVDSGDKQAIEIDGYNLSASVL
jgi:hypothetical protein